MLRKRESVALTPDDERFGRDTCQTPDQIGVGVGTVGKGADQRPPPPLALKLWTRASIRELSAEPVWLRRGDKAQPCEETLAELLLVQRIERNGRRRRSSQTQ